MRSTNALPQKSPPPSACLPSATCPRPLANSSKGTRLCSGDSTLHFTQAVKQLKTSVTSTDHALSKSGLAQASTLQANLATALRRVLGNSGGLTDGLTDAEAEASGFEDDQEDLSELDSLRATELGPVISMLLHSQTLWTSPLARAVQTAMLALQPLAVANSATEGEPLPIEVKRHARERRELTNLTTSIGNSCGEHIRTRCVQKLKDLREGGEAVARGESLSLNTTEVEAQWWSTNPEPDKEYQARVNELIAQVHPRHERYQTLDALHTLHALHARSSAPRTARSEARSEASGIPAARQRNVRRMLRAYRCAHPSTHPTRAQLQYTPAESVVLVAHQDLIQELLSRYVHPDARERLHDTIHPLMSHVPHCTVLWCCFDFRRQRPITDLAVRP